MISGELPRRTSSLLLEWLALHREELEANWVRARLGQPLVAIAPLERAMIHVTSVLPRGDHTLHVAFSDGLEGDVDLGPFLHGEMLEPLRDPARFRAAYVDEELGTVVWPGGADVAPEFLYDAVAGRGRSVADGTRSE